MFSINAQTPVKKSNGTYTTYKTEISPTNGKKFVRPTVHIPISQQKWVAPSIAKGEYGSLEKVKAKYPGMKVTVVKQTKDTVEYGVEDTIDIAYVTVKQTKKGEIVEINERRWSPEARFVTATYENGKLKSAYNEDFYSDPYGGIE